MLEWTLTDVARALDVPVPPGVAPQTPVRGLSIDSRTLAPGELFFAIRGPRFDGHDFVLAALQAGACGAVVERSRLANYPEPWRGRLMGVADPAGALAELARAVRRAWGQLPGRRLVAITGSTGKTTTKEMVAALLATRMPVLKSEGNLNNAFGLPLTLGRLEKTHQAAVVELGMSARGELRRLAEIAEPEIGVVTNVGPVHLEFFPSVDAIALAKRELIEGLAGESPVAVLNADDPRVSRFVEVFAGSVVWFGTKPSAQVRIEEMQDRGFAGVAFRLRTPTEEGWLELPLLGVHQIWNAAAAVATASLWGVGLSAARQALATLEPVGHRGRLLPFDAGFVVIDDCYNSNPPALAAMIQWLARLDQARRKVLVAGEMLELGPTAPQWHREAGRLAAGQLDWILGVQGAAAALVQGAVEAGHPAERARFFDTAEEAADFLAHLVQAGDVVLLKGSRGVRLERVLERLRERHAPRSAPPPSGGVH